MDREPDRGKVRASVPTPVPAGLNYVPTGVILSEARGNIGGCDPLGAGEKREDDRGGGGFAKCALGEGPTVLLTALRTHWGKEGTPTSRPS